MLFFNLTFNASQKWSLYWEGSYAYNRDMFDSFQLPDPEEAPVNWDNDFSGINEYSDLKYKQLDTTVGASWKFSAKSNLYGSFTVMDVQDDAPYVYDGLSGTLLMTSLGMTVLF